MSTQADRLDEIKAKWFRALPGHEQRDSIPGVVMCCIAPDARECLDDVMAAWEEHYQSLKRNNPPGYEPGFYGFAYWLVRWSGLVLPRQSAGADLAYLIGEVERLRKALDRHLPSRAELYGSDPGFTGDIRESGGD